MGQTKIFKGKKMSNRKLKTTWVHKCVDTLTSTFITQLILFGLAATFAHTLCESAPYLPDCEGTLQMFDGTRVWTVAGSSHSKASFIFWWSHCFVDLDVCFGSFGGAIFSFLTESQRFCANTDWYLDLSIVLSILPQFQCKKKCLKALCCHHYASLYCRNGVNLMCSVVFAAKIPFGIMSHKSSVSSDQNIFGTFQMSLGKMEPGLGVFLWKIRLLSCHATPKSRRTKKTCDPFRMFYTTSTCQELLQIIQCCSWPLGSLPEQFSSCLTNSGRTSCSCECHCCAIFSPLCKDCIHDTLVIPS